MLASVTSCNTVLEMNAARRDLFNQVFKRGLTVEEFDHGYENLFQHAEAIGLRYHIDFRTYGPRNVEPMRKLLNDIRYSRFLNQFNQGAGLLREHQIAGKLDSKQFDMAWTLLIDRATFQGYEWQEYRLAFTQT